MINELNLNILNDSLKIPSVPATIAYFKELLAEEWGPSYFIKKSRFGENRG